MRTAYWLAIATCLIEASWGVLALFASGGHPYGRILLVMGIGSAALSFSALTFPHAATWTLALIPQVYFGGFSALRLVLYIYDFAAGGFAEPAIGMRTMLADMAQNAATIAVAGANLFAVTVYAYGKMRPVEPVKGSRRSAGKNRRTQPGLPETGIKPAPTRPDAVCRLPERKLPRTK